MQPFFVLKYANVINGKSVLIFLMFFTQDIFSKVHTIGLLMTS